MDWQVCAMTQRQCACLRIEPNGIGGHRQGDLLASGDIAGGPGDEIDQNQHPVSSSIRTSSRVMGPRNVTSSTCPRSASGGACDGSITDAASGRHTASTLDPAGTPPLSATGRRALPQGITGWPSIISTVVTRRLLDPMKPAVKRVAGLSYSSRGDPIWLT